MHRTEGDANVGGRYSEGDPGIPTPPTQLTPQALNALQEEIAQTIEGAGLTLRTQADDEAADFQSQLLEAIRLLSPIKAWARLAISSFGGSTVVNVVQGFGISAAEVVQTASNWDAIRITFDKLFGTNGLTDVRHGRVFDVAQMVAQTVTRKNGSTAAYEVNVYDQPSLNALSLSTQQIALQCRDNAGALYTDLRGQGFHLLLVAYA